MAVNCSICGAEAARFGTARILGRYDVSYFRCPACGFVQTEKPYWLAEAYASAFSPCDLGLIRRNLELARITTAVLGLLFRRGRSFLDYGGGTGMFVRMMRDNGYDFRWYDRYASNAFAAGFEDDGHRRYDLVTAFEVLEHMEDPVAAVRGMLARGESVLLSTILLPEPAPVPGQWWYYGVESGQHIAFFTVKALRELARQCGLRLYTDASSMHLLTARRLPDLVFRMLCRQAVAGSLQSLAKRPTLLHSDYEQVLKRMRGPTGEAPHPGPLPQGERGGE